MATSVFTTDIGAFVEPLVDSVSQLVMSSIQGNMDDVIPCCTQISMFTIKLIHLGKDAADSVDDRDHALRIVDSIERITAKIETLVTSFERLCETRGNDEKIAFGEAAKDIGEAIDQLVVNTDKSGEVQMGAVGKQAIESAERLVAAAKGSDRQELVDAARLHADTTQRVHSTTGLVADGMSDPARKRLLQDLAGRIKSEGPTIVVAAQGAFGKGGSSALTSSSQQYITSVRRAMEAAVKPPRDESGWSKVSSVVDYVKKLVEMARKMQEAADRLYEASQKGDPEDFIAAAKEAAKTALQLVKAAEDVAEKHPDPLMRQMIDRKSVV